MKINTWYRGYNSYRVYFFLENSPGRFLGFVFDVKAPSNQDVDIWDNHEMEEANVKMDPSFMQEAGHKVLKDIFERDYIKDNL